MAYHKNLGCYNNIIGWAACKEQTLISHSSGCWRSEIKAVADSVSGGGSLPRSCMSLHCVLRWWRGRGNSLGLFLKGCLSCSRGFHPHDAIPSQRPRLQMPYGDSVSTWVWGVTRTSSLHVPSGRERAAETALPLFLWPGQTDPSPPPSAGDVKTGCGGWMEDSKAQPSLLITKEI